VQLVCDGSVVDAVGYEYSDSTFATEGGTFAGEGTPVTVDPKAWATGRCPDGADTGDNAADFGTWETPTPGSPNPCGG